MNGGELGKKYKDGEIICREGDEARSMYVIQSGTAEVIKKGLDGEFTMTELKAGDIFGEMSLFDHLPRSATIRATGETVVLSIDKKGFFSWASEDPSLTFNILESMSRRIRTLNQEISGLMKKKTTHSNNP
jgi:CRP-like cAMP-binding protein